MPTDCIMHDDDDDDDDTKHSTPNVSTPVLHLNLCKFFLEGRQPKIGASEHTQKYFY